MDHLVHRLREYTQRNNHGVFDRDQLEKFAIAVNTLTSERDRLAAENAELRKVCETATACQIIVKMEADIQTLISQLAAATATLDALTNAFPNLDAMHEILYPKETTAHPLQVLADSQVPPVPEFDAIATECFHELLETTDAG